MMQSDAKGYFFQSLRLVKASLRAERVLRHFSLSSSQRMVMVSVRSIIWPIRADFC